MAKLYYYYGAMGSSKTANALMTHFNYEEVGQNALLVKPKLDTRDGERIVRSRIGLQNECVSFQFPVFKQKTTAFQAVRGVKKPLLPNDPSGL